MCKKYFGRLEKNEFARQRVNDPAARVRSVQRSVV